MQVTTRPATQVEQQFLMAAVMPAPVVNIGSLLRCTNANTGRFTHNSVYRVHRTAHNAASGLALPVVHDDRGVEVVLSSLSFGLKHWVKA